MLNPSASTLGLPANLEYRPRKVRRGMNVGRLCSIEGSQQLDTHQRASEYLKVVCSRYGGMGFTSRIEWIGEQTIDAMRLLLADTSCTEEERKAVERFLDLASEELPGAL
jgi:hypothetical protein